VQKGKKEAQGSLYQLLNFFKLTFIMLHYTLILRALNLNIHSMDTCIYNLSTVYSGFFRYSKFTFGVLMYYLFFDLLSTAL
jgi:hypothetical protein